MPIDYKELNAMALWIQQKPNQRLSLFTLKRELPFLLDYSVEFRILQT